MDLEGRAPSRGSVPWLERQRSLADLKSNLLQPDDCAPINPALLKQPRIGSWAGSEVRLLRQVHAQGQGVDGRAYASALAWVGSW